MNSNQNIIGELDKLVVHHFNKEKPFEIGDNIIPVTYLRGSPDKLLISDLWTNVSDIKYPAIVITRDASFKLMPERGTVKTEATQIKFIKIEKNKYILEDQPNINVEIYLYDSPIYFTTKYNIIFFCEYVKHANEFQSMFIDRLNQQYYKITSEKYQSLFFDAVFMNKEGLNIEDNYNETADSKRIIKVTADIYCEGYYLSQASETINRTISKTAMNAYLQ